MIENKYYDLGNIKFHEMVVVTLFSIMVILWFFRAPEFITGWGDLITQLYGNDM